MKSVLLAMTENQHDHRSWRCTGLVGACILLTLALNASTREQAALMRETYKDSNDNILLIFTAAVTVGQVLAAIAAMTAETPRGELPDKEALMIIFFSHAGTTFLHDFLMSLGSAENFVTMSFFQPLLILFAVWIVTSVIAKPTTWLSVIMIGTGCTFMSINSSTIFESDRTALICLLISFTMVLRNIVLRQLVNTENITFKLRTHQVIFGIIGTTAIFVVMIYLLASSLYVLPAICAAAICALSAALFYVTAQILQSYSLVFVSVFHMWALLIEAIIITPMHHRPSIMLLATGVILIFIGHYLLFKDYVDHTDNNGPVLIPSISPKPVNAHEQYTRIEFLLFASFVMGVIFYVFQPSISQRDLDTLSYVGLDKVIRKLLSTKEDGSNAL